jgi:6-phosphogluconolactonase
VKLEILEDAERVAARAAELVADSARAAVASRGCFAFALSGGSTPWLMLRALSRKELPWPSVHLFQVDERVAPAGDPARNWGHVEENLLRRVSLAPAQVHPMPVEEGDLEAAARDYARELEAVAGSPPVLDLVHLGLGDDGHTASLVPDDPVLDVRAADVAVVGPYRGHRRMTLTCPMLDRARRILWLVTGASKAGMLPRLQQGDSGIPAGRLRQDRACLLVDTAASTPAQRRPL